MLTVLIAGAGKSSSSLIDYMLDNAKRKWKVVIMDANAEMVAEKLNGHPKGTAAIVDIHDDQKRQTLVKEADLVISMLPHSLHIILARDCLRFKKHLITASYVSPEMQAMSQEVADAGLLFMCEMGLDPGIDHMSATALINSIHRIAGVVKSFKSSCGGLIAPESDDNPWHYKISWNPRNVVLAGKDGAAWLENGKTQELSYQDLFANTRKVTVKGLGTLSAYANRDSLKYLKLYDLDEVKTFMRSTLRYPSFTKGWNIIVRAGLTDENDQFNLDETTYADWIAKKTGVENNDDLRQNFRNKWKADDKEMKLLEWLRIFDNRQMTASGMHTSSDILLGLIQERWKMKVLDKDMVLMQHQVEYERRGATTRLTTTLRVEGDNRQNSAMAKCVGLPVAILAKKILMDEINPAKIAGVRIPVMPEVYVPVLKELKKYDIEFMEEID